MKRIKNESENDLKSLFLWNYVGISLPSAQGDGCRMLSGKNTDRSCMFRGVKVKERAKKEDRLSQQRVERELSLNSVTSLIM